MEQDKLHLLILHETLAFGLGFLMTQHDPLLKDLDGRLVVAFLALQPAILLLRFLEQFLGELKMRVLDQLRQY